MLTCSRTRSCSCSHAPASGLSLILDLGLTRHTLLTMLLAMCSHSCLHISELQVKDANGRLIGVKSPCMHCGSNRCVDITDRGLSVHLEAEKPADIGIRFIYSADGTIVPIAATVVCRSSTCPANIKKLEKKGFTWDKPTQPMPKKGYVETRSLPY